ncbi:hypothetical protein E4Z66_14190 [Aliishimia ponticola]|uniref:Uncharacterized protein n=1 Tax=Aliishimia ponticola TaxID=2499833 RepID=A0A4S4NBY3_9RHOB|nr:hypothetical protein [Aliishimia ponticola]THH36195.1 hypothetical protein E4Z66_14190 [Aliishimia ponticola]
MGLQLRWLSLMAYLITGPTFAEGWVRDVWHIVSDDSPFFAPDRPDQNAAALLQSDGRFALLVLGTDAQGALVSVNLPGTTAAERLTSTLVIANGTVLTREISGDQLLAQPIPDGETVTYSFRIAPGDLESFMAASEWRLNAGGTVTTLTLDGSRKAVSAAIEARDDTRLYPSRHDD